MNRTLATAAALLLSTGAVLANGIVPGSDTTTRDLQTLSDTAVATGSYRSEAGVASRYGYPTEAQARRASDAADERASNDATRTSAPSPRAALIPGSDSF